MSKFIVKNYLYFKMGGSIKSNYWHIIGYLNLIMEVVEFWCTLHSGFLVVVMSAWINIFFWAYKKGIDFFDTTTQCTVAGLVKPSTILSHVMYKYSFATNIDRSLVYILNLILYLRYFFTIVLCLKYVIKQVQCWIYSNILLI